MPRLIDKNPIHINDENPESAFESKALFQLLMDGAKDYAIFALDADGNVATWSESAKLLHGYAAEEILGKHLSIFYPAEDLASGKPERELECARREGAYQEEGRRVGKDGIPFWASVVITPTFDSAGKLIGYSKVTRNISERYLLSQQLNTFFDISPDMLIVVGFDGYFKRPSPSFQRAIDYSLEELMAVPWLNYVHPEDKDSTLEAVAELEVGNGTVSFECRFKCRDGGDRRFRWNAVPIPERRLIFAIGRDVTDSSKGEQRFRGLLEAAPDAVVIENANSEIIYVNSQTEKLFGFPRSEVLGNKVEILIPNRFGDHRSEHPEGFFTTPGRRAIGVGFDLYGVRNDGTEFPVEISLSPMETDGGMLVISAIRDVSHRKQAEDARLVQIELLRKSQQALERAQEVAKLGNWELDLETSKMTWSKQLFTLLGVDPETTEPTRSAKFSRFVPEDALLAEAAFARAVNEGLPYALDLQCVVAEGDSAQWIHAIGKPEFNADGKVVRLVGTAMDITRRKRSEAALRSSEERLRLLLCEQEAANTRLRISEESLLSQSQELLCSNTDLEQFAHVASHDLQEPLRMVASFMQLLEKKYKGQLDDQADRWIDHAVDGANRMQALIQDLLIYSRVGTHGKEFKPCDMAAVLNLSLRNLQLVISECKAEITVDPLPSLNGDAVQFVSLFQNLIANAIKYRGENPPKIHVSVAREGADWIFSISDNGIGILPQFADRIFVIFQRLHSRTSYPGTGIGLALCKRIVERHGGRIWMESDPGKGTTFYVQLPENDKEDNNANA